MEKRALSLSLLSFSPSLMAATALLLLLLLFLLPKSGILRARSMFIETVSSRATKIKKRRGNVNARHTKKMKRETMIKGQRFFFFRFVCKKKKRVIFFFYLLLFFFPFFLPFILRRR